MLIHDEIPYINNEESTETHRLETVESDQPNLDDIDLDLEGLKDLKSKNFHNPFISHLNINSLRYKITELREILTVRISRLLFVKPGFHLDFFCLLLLFVAFRTNKMPQRAMRCSNGNIHKKPKRATKSHNEQ